MIGRYTQGRPVIPTRLAKRSTAPLVTVAELAEECGLPPDAGLTKLAALGIRVVGDWAGRPSVTLENAAKAYGRIVGDIEAHTTEWVKYQQYVQEREERRSQAIQQAATEARKTGFAGSPEQEGRAAQASAEARERFEAEEPLLGFDEFRPGGDDR